MPTESPAKRYVRSEPQPSRQIVPVKRIIVGTWIVGSALVFLIFLQLGIEERAALPLIAMLATALSAELVAGVVCLLKGYTAVGVLASTVWLTFPAGRVISSALFPESSEPALLGSALAAGLILVVAAQAAITAPQPARWDSFWSRAGWTEPKARTTR